MEDKDFRPDDPATCITPKFQVIRGYIALPDLHSTHIITFFGEDKLTRVFFRDGTCNRGDPYPQLYHGHNVTFQIIGEEKPKRKVKKYVNLYYIKSTVKKDPIQSGPLHDTEEEAQNQAAPICAAVAVPIEVPEEE